MKGLPVLVGWRRGTSDELIVHRCEACSHRFWVGRRGGAGPRVEQYELLTLSSASHPPGATWGQALAQACGAPSRLPWPPVFRVTRLSPDLELREGFKACVT